MISRTDHADDGAAGSGHASRKTKAADTAFEGGYFFFERGYRRVAGTAVGIAFLKVFID